MLITETLKSIEEYPESYFRFVNPDDPSKMQLFNTNIMYHRSQCLDLTSQIG